MASFWFVCEAIRRCLNSPQKSTKNCPRWAQSRMLPAGDVFRAKLILALASGKSYGGGERKLQTSPPTIARWKQRFEERRIAGLKPLHRGTRPRVATASAQAR